jgi:nucleoside-diphosphate-sugar epimerase
MKIFVTGATGYIGGSVAARLVGLGHAVLGLVQSREKGLLLRERGIDPVLGTLDDWRILADSAQAADAVIHAASADHPGSVLTLIGVLERSAKPLIYTTGSGIVADSADGEYPSSVIFSEDTYFEPVPFRRPRVEMIRLVREAGISIGIRTVVICPTMVYGTGRGLQPDSDQLPKLIALSKQLGAGVYFGKGLNRYSNVRPLILTLQASPTTSDEFAGLIGFSYVEPGLLFTNRIQHPVAQKAPTPYPRLRTTTGANRR